MTTTLLAVPNTLTRILNFPLTRLLLALIFFMLPYLLIQKASLQFIEDKTLAKIGQLCGACVGYLCYAFYVRKIEKRVPVELSLQGILPEFGTGFLLGGLMVGATIGVISLFGGYQIIATSPWSVIFIPLLKQITVSMIEELLMRGIVFRILQQSLGSWLALLISAVLFGAAHLVNDHVSFLGITYLVVSGVSLAAAFMLTGRLWMCIGLHAAWNFTQDAIFSVAVSGHDAINGLLIGKMTGADWLTGAAFGIEGSVIALVVEAAVAGILLYKVIQRGQIIVPYWKRA